MLEHIRKIVDSLPSSPGVYLMKNSAGFVIYVGKAKDLRQRVRQYFIAGRDERSMVPFLVSKIADIETIIVFSEKEALLLENTLIKKYQPTYNILLKDDKTYVALKVNTHHVWPMVQLVRYRGRPDPDGLYFGPYTSAEAAKTTLDLLHRLFPLRQCSDQELVRRTRPCILYDMKRCIAPCVFPQVAAEYRQYLDRVIKFLRGQDREIVTMLYKEMEEHAKALEFERAEYLLQQIRQIEKTLEGQRVDKPLGGDLDVIGLFREGEKAAVMQLFIRQGQLIETRPHLFAQVIEDDFELLTSFILQRYQNQEEVPPEIVVPIEFAETTILADILSDDKRRRVKITSPKRGEKHALLEMAVANAKALYMREKDPLADREKTLLDMQEKFKLTNYPREIECFDNSSISGAFPVSALVVFREGEKEKSQYRKYKIKAAAGSDDYGAMQEVLTRRYQKALESNSLPDLVIVDGGKGHLNIARKVFADLNIISVDIIACAKEGSRHDKGMTLEQIFLQDLKEPVILHRHSPILLLLQRIRDEAHRFAHTFQRQRYTKQTLSTRLEEIEGIGPKKSRALLRHFGSIQQLRQATLETLLEVKGISRVNAEAICKFFERK